MELIGTIFVTLLVGAAPAALAAVLKALVHAVARVLVVADASQVSALDHLFATGWCSARVPGPGDLPADGVHLALRRGVLVARRSACADSGACDTTYTVYALGAGAAAALRDLLVGDAADVPHLFIEKPNPWKTVRTWIACAPPGVARGWQVAAVRDIVSAFRVGGPAVTALAAGPPGSGKSALGILVAAELRRALGLAATVVRGVDLTAKGFTIEDATGTPDKHNPLVLVLDEFDGAIDAAEAPAEQKSKSEGRSLADTPTSLLNLFERIAVMRNLIVIATSNRTLADLTSGAYTPYTRRGRFALWFAAPSTSSPWVRKARGARE